MIYVAFLPETAGEDVFGRLASAAGGLVEAAAAAPGCWAGPRWPAGGKSRVAGWGKGRADVALMRRVKQVFDPAGILSPGRFVGGM